MEQINHDDKKEWGNGATLPETTTVNNGAAGDPIQENARRRRGKQCDNPSPELVRESHTLEEIQDVFSLNRVKGLSYAQLEEQCRGLALV